MNNLNCLEKNEFNGNNYNSNLDSEYQNVADWNFNYNGENQNSTLTGSCRFPNAKPHSGSFNVLDIETYKEKFTADHLGNFQNHNGNQTLNSSAFSFFEYDYLSFNDDSFEQENSLTRNASDISNADLNTLTADDIQKFFEEFCGDSNSTSPASNLESRQAFDLMEWSQPNDQSSMHGLLAEHCAEPIHETNCFPELNFTEFSSTSRTINKKQQRRCKFTSKDLEYLFKAFNESHYASPETLTSLSQSLGKQETKIKTWFQNQRARLKKHLQKQKNSSMCCRKHINVYVPIEHSMQLYSEDNYQNLNVPKPDYSNFQSIEPDNHNFRNSTYSMLPNEQENVLSVRGFEKFHF